MRIVKIGMLCIAVGLLGIHQKAHAQTASPAGGQLVLRATPLGPMPSDIRDVSITPDGSHVALAANIGTRRDVFVDGNEGQPYSSLVQMPSLRGGAPRLLMISADGTRFAYVATKGPTEYVMLINQKE